MKKNTIKATTAAVKEELNIESITIDASVLIHEYDMATYAVDDAALANYQARKGMIGILEKIVKAGYTSLQSGHTKAKKPKLGEFPYLVANEEFKTNYLARHHKLWRDAEDKLPLDQARHEYVAPSKTELDNVVKQKIATMSFFIETKKYTTNVGNDKPKLMCEVYNEKWLSLLQDKKAAEVSNIRVAGIAAASLKQATEMQAAVVLAAKTNAPAAVVKIVESKETEANVKANIDAIAAVAAQNLLDDITAEVADIEEKKSLAEQVAEVKKNKKKKVPSVATDADGITNHDASTVISKDAGISRDSALRVKKAIAAVVDHMSLIEVREVRRGLGLVLLDAKMEM
jgi:hypothetical protein